MNPFIWEPRPAWNPCHGERQRPAWQAMVQALYAEGEMDHEPLSRVGLAASDLNPKTVEKLILEGRHHGYLAQVTGSKALHTRRYRLTNRCRLWLTGQWPPAEAAAEAA